MTRVVLATCLLLNLTLLCATQTVAQGTCGPLQTTSQPKKLDGPSIADALLAIYGLGRTVEAVQTMNQALKGYTYGGLKWVDFLGTLLFLDGLLEDTAEENYATNSVFSILPTASFAALNFAATATFPYAAIAAVALEAYRLLEALPNYASKVVSENSVLHQVQWYFDARDGCRCTHPNILNSQNCYPGVPMCKF